MTRGSWTERALRGGFAAMMVLVVLLECFGIGYGFSAEYLVLTLLGALGVFAAWKLNRRFPPKKCTAKRVYLTLLALTAALTVWCCLMALNLYFMTGWDARTVRLASAELAAQYSAGAEEVTNSYASYFQNYPNNMGLTAFFTAVRVALNALHIGAQEAVLAILTMLNIPVSALLTGCVGWKLFHTRRGAVASFLLTALLTGLNAWNTIPYTDPYAMTFVTLTMFLFVTLRDRPLPPAAKILPVTLSAVLGAMIKPTCVIVLIAIALVQLAAVRDFRPHRWLWKRALCLLLCAVISLGAWTGLQSLCCRVLQVTPDEDAAFPMLHFVAMGLNEETTGTFNSDDVYRTAQAATKEEKRAVCLETIRERLAGFGFFGYLRFLGRKLLGIYYSGMYYWEICTEWYFEDIPAGLMGGLTDWMRGVFYPTSDGFEPLRLLMQLVWLGLLCGCALAGCRSIRVTRPAADRRLLEALFLSLIGITLFLLLFECSARHLIGFAGVMALICVSAFTGASETADRKRPGPMKKPAG